MPTERRFCRVCGLSSFLVDFPTLPSIYYPDLALCLMCYDKGEVPWPRRNGRYSHEQGYLTYTTGGGKYSQPCYYCTALCRNGTCISCQHRHREEYQVIKQARTIEWKRTHPRLTTRDYVAQLKRQHGVCAICHKKETSQDPKTGKVRRLATDHDHSTGKIRGLLCRKCNLGLSYFCDSTVYIARAYHYLRR